MKTTAVPKQVPKQLTPWKKGQSGNPGGRPKSAHDFSEMIRTFLAEKGPTRKTKLRELVERLYQDDAKTLLAYGFGKPIETHEVTGPAGTSLRPEVIALGRQIAISLTTTQSIPEGDLKGVTPDPCQSSLTIKEKKIYVNDKVNGKGIKSNGETNGH